MGIYDTLKDVASIAQKIDNIELMKQVIELQQQVVTLYEENRQLNERLATREKLTFKNNSYWMGDNGPFCSNCWDVHVKLIRLHLFPSDTSPRCPNCKQYAPNMK
jgi:hypothetical protein